MSKNDNLKKGPIVGQCHVCSETWDLADLKDSDKTGKCPYCGYVFDDFADRKL